MGALVAVTARRDDYRIYLNRNRYYFFIFQRFVRLLFKGGFYFFI